MDELIEQMYEENLHEAFESDADPNGSYTGTCTDNEYADVTQDVDDL